MTIKTDWPISVPNCRIISAAAAVDKLSVCISVANIVAEKDGESLAAGGAPDGYSSVRRGMAASQRTSRDRRQGQALKSPS